MYKGANDTQMALVKLIDQPSRLLLRTLIPSVEGEESELYRRLPALRTCCVVPQSEVRGRGVLREENPATQQAEFAWAAASLPTFLGTISKQLNLNVTTRRTSLAASVQSGALEGIEKANKWLSKMETERAPGSGFPFPSSPPSPPTTPSPPVLPTGSPLTETAREERDMEAFSTMFGTGRRITDQTQTRPSSDTGTLRPPPGFDMQPTHRSYVKELEFPVSDPRTLTATQPFAAPASRSLYSGFESSHRLPSRSASRNTSHAPVARQSNTRGSGCLLYTSPSPRD